MVTKTKTPSRKPAAAKKVTKKPARKTVAKARSKPAPTKTPVAKARVSGVPAPARNPVSNPVSNPVAKPAPQGVTKAVQPMLPVLGKKQLIDSVVTRSGIKKKDAKPVVEAMLAVLGEAIAEGRELNLRPFGKVKIQRQFDKPSAKVTVARIRQPKSQGTDAPKDPLVEAAE